MHGRFSIWAGLFLNRVRFPVSILDVHCRRVGTNDGAIVYARWMFHGVDDNGVRFTHSVSSGVGTFCIVSVATTKQAAEYCRYEKLFHDKVFTSRLQFKCHLQHELV